MGERHADLQPPVLRAGNRFPLALCRSARRRKSKQALVPERVRPRAV